MDKADLRELLKAEIELFKALSFYVGGLATGIYFILNHPVLYKSIDLTDFLLVIMVTFFIFFSIFLGISLLSIIDIKNKIRYGRLD